MRDAQIARELELAQYGEQISILDMAEAPLRPVSPLWKVALFGFAAAIFLTASVGIAREQIDRVITRTEQAEALTDLPVIGSVARIR